MDAAKGCREPTNGSFFTSTVCMQILRWRLFPNERSLRSVKMAATEATGAATGSMDLLDTVPSLRGNQQQADRASASYSPKEKDWKDYCTLIVARDELLACGITDGDVSKLPPVIQSTIYTVTPTRAFNFIFFMRTESIILVLAGTRAITISIRLITIGVRMQRPI